MSVTGTIHLPTMEPEWRDGLDWTPYTSLAPHPWDAFVHQQANWRMLHPEPEPEHVLFDGYCPQCGGCCLVGFGNPA